MTRVTCRLTAKNQDQFRNPVLGNGVWATLPFTFFNLKYVKPLDGYILLAEDMCELEYT